LSLNELDLLCRRRGWKLVLEVTDPTGHVIRDWEGAASGFMRVRVLADGEVLAGRIQSEPGLEHADVLAAGVVGVLRKRGVVT
jgi:hypothetical protein